MSAPVLIVDLEPGGLTAGGRTAGAPRSRVPKANGLSPSVSIAAGGDECIRCADGAEATTDAGIAIPWPAARGALIAVLLSTAALRAVRPVAAVDVAC
jgi:hypothetical protein